MSMSRAAQVTYFLLRVVAGFLFFQAGAVILLGWFGGMPGQPSPPPLMSQVGIGGILEFFGGIAVLLGLCTPPGAFILSGEMAGADWQVHPPPRPRAPQKQGEPPPPPCFPFPFLAG